MTEPRVTNAILLERLEVVRCDVSESKAKIDRLVDERLTNAVEHKEITEKLEAVEVRSKSNSDRIEKLTKVVERLTVPIQILGWIAGIVGAAVLGLVWLLITGQVTLVFP